MSAYAERVAKAVDSGSARMAWRPKTVGLGRVVESATGIASLLQGSRACVAAASGVDSSSVDVPALSCSADQSIAPLNAGLLNSAAASASSINFTVPEGLQPDSRLPIPLKSIGRADEAVEHFKRCSEGNCLNESIEVKSVVLQPYVERLGVSLRFESGGEFDFLFTLKFCGVAQVGQEGNAASENSRLFGRTCLQTQRANESAIVVLIRPDTSGLPRDGPERALMRRWEATYAVRRVFDEAGKVEDGRPRVCLVPDLRVEQRDGGEQLLKSTASMLQRLLRAGYPGLFDRSAVVEFFQMIDARPPNEVVKAMFKDEAGRAMLYEIVRERIHEMILTHCTTKTFHQAPAARFEEAALRRTSFRNGRVLQRRRLIFLSSQLSI